MGLDLMYSRRAFSIFSLASVSALAVGAPLRAFGQVGANINLSPRRVVFEANSRSSTVLVFNTGAEPATYNVAVVERVMTLEGGVIGLDDVPKTQPNLDAIGRLKSARDMVTFTPRRVVLNPGETQTIRLRVLRPPELPPGEYRTHLTVTAVPPPDQGLTAEEATAQASSGLSVRLTPLFSISIPLIIRQGPPEIGVELANVRYKPSAAGAGVVTLEIVRKGASSLYGDVEIRTAGASRTSKPLGALGGVAVYPEIDRRFVEIPVTRALSSGEKLEIVFRDEDTKPGQIITSVAFSTA
jgi:P pilus assembly chaperone PapD